MRIAIYARKSTEREDRQVQSLEDQIKILRALARHEGLPEPVVFEEARSATRPKNRPEFDRLMACVERGEIGGILTWSINRLSRNDLESGIVGQFLHDGAIQYIWTPERKYLPEDNALLYAVESGMATAYGQDLRRNVRRGMKGKAERGWACSKAPVGYLNNIETRAIDIDASRFHLVKHGWEQLLTGEKSVNQIHRELVQLGLTVSSRKGRFRPISRARLHTLFRQRFYAGEVEFKGEIFPGRHEPMITLQEFERAQGLLGKNRTPRTEPSKSFALGGALICSVCGCRIVGERRVKIYPRTGRTATYTYYHCSGYRGCSKRAIREEALADVVAEPLSKLSIDRDTAGWIKDALLEAVERDSTNEASKVSAYEDQLRREDSRLKNLTMLRLDNEIDSADYHDIRLELTNRMEALRDKVQAAQEFTTTFLNQVYERLDAAVQAGEILCNGNDIPVLGQILRLTGKHHLNLESPRFQLDPLLRKITAFEPLRDGSERPKRGDYVPLNSVWWTLVDDIRKISCKAAVSPTLPM